MIDILPQLQKMNPSPLPQITVSVESYPLTQQFYNFVHAIRKDISDISTIKFVNNELLNKKSTQIFKKLKLGLILSMMKQLIE